MSDGARSNAYRQWLAESTAGGRSLSTTAPAQNWGTTGLPVAARLSRCSSLSRSPQRVASRAWKIHCNMRHRNAAPDGVCPLNRKRLTDCICEATHISLYPQPPADRLPWQHCTTPRGQESLPGPAGSSAIIDRRLRSARQVPQSAATDVDCPCRCCCHRPYRTCPNRPAAADRGLP